MSHVKLFEDRLYSMEESFKRYLIYQFKENPTLLTQIRYENKIGRWL